MADLTKLKERQKSLEDQRRKVNALIRKTEEEERVSKFLNAGLSLYDHYINDPLCKDSSKIAAICSKFFILPTTTESTSTKESTGTVIADLLKK